MSQERRAGNHIFTGGGEMGELMRSYDWSQTLLGEVETWPQSLRTALSICLNSRFPMVIWWGQALVLLYNDAWRPILGTKHPQSLGKPGQQIWPEIWDIIGTQLNSVLETQEATWSDDMLLLVDRFGYVEEAYFTYSYSPIFLETGAVGGAFTAVTETTQRVIGERRLSTLRELAANTAEARAVAETCRIACTTLANNLYDIPFALLYRVENNGQQAQLAGISGSIAEMARPPQIDLTQSSAQGDLWQLAQVQKTAEAVLIEDLEQYGNLPGGAWPEAARSAIVLPVTQSGQKQQLSGLLVLGISPRREFDDRYRGFFDLVVSHVATAIADASAYEEARRQAEVLAELDRAKTVFFSNVSHEFRTPLTLMLGPLEDLLTHPENLPVADREQIATVHRNSLRLLKLVNTLLDFSRIEAGRIQARYEPTDLSRLTAELASLFRSATERAGLRLTVNCPTLPAAVYVDREMWEKILLNLLSNAFKFTFAGEITVALEWMGDRVELRVKDTGTGIPAAEIPRLFERFHRVPGAYGRTYEGSGIGLSLTQELVKLHHGEIQVASVVNQGTCFTVSIPTGSQHLPPAQIQAASNDSSSDSSNDSTKASTVASTGANTTTAAAYVEEALSWLSEGSLENIPVYISNYGPEYRLDNKFDSKLDKTSAGSYVDASPKRLSAERILLVDDNADMRSYLRRLLSEQGYAVATAADGMAALAAIQQQLPDLVLTDVMMPRLDGFGLLQQLRADSTTQDLPIILLSARAGEEARIEGLAAGADDYLTKPFSARELLARVEANLKLVQLRREAGAREQLLRQAAEAAQQQVETILSSIDDGFYRLDCSWQFTYVNDQLCEIAEMQRAEMLGRSIWELFPDLVGTEFEVQFRWAMDAQLPHNFENFYPRWNRWYHQRLYPSPAGLTVLVTDITSRKQTELLLIEQQRLLELTAAGRPAADCFAALCDAVTRLNPSVRACFLLANTQQQQISDSIAPDFPPSFGAGFTDLPINELCIGTCGEALYRGQPVVCTDIVQDDRWSQAWRDLCVTHGVLACYSAPVMSLDHLPLGSLMLCFSEARLPTDWEYQLAEFGTQIASIVFERDHSIQTVQESKAQLDFLLGAAQFGDWDLDLTDYRAYRSLKHDQIFGYESLLPEWTYEMFLDHVLPEERVAADRRFRTALSHNQPWNFECRIQRADGQVRWIWVNGYIYQNIAGVPARMLGLVADITDRKQAEEALRLSEARYRLLTSILTSIVWIFDPEGAFVTPQVEWETYTGQTWAEYQAFGWVQALHPEDRELVFTEFQQAKAQRRLFQAEGRIWHAASAEYHYFEARGLPLFNLDGSIREWIGNITDIHSRQSTEAELRQKNAILNLINESAPTPIFVKDRQGQIIYANPATLEVLGKSAAEVIGYRDCDLYPNYEDAARVMANDQRIMASGETEVVEESPDGIRTFLGMKSPYRNEAGEVIGLIGISNDISARVQLERDRERILQQEQAARKAAEEANRIKDEFLAVLSHELRSPLNPILGWAKLLQTRKLDEAKTAQALTTIERNAKLQSELIEDLLDVSRILQGKLSLNVAPVELGSVTRAAIETVRLAAEAKSIQIETHLSAEAQVLGDATRLQQVIWNLLSNAVKFTPAAGRVTVTLELIEHQAQLTVADSGRGIPAEFLPHVFDYFRQADGSTTRQFGGLGLGLAIVRHLVELHGGTVWAESAGEAQGAQFTVRLPLMPSQPAIPPAANLPNPAVHLNGIRVLVVDDEADSREFVAFVLEQAGAVVTTAAAPEAAVAALTQFQPDLLVSDIGMPEMDGYMFIQYLRSLSPEQFEQVPAIALTAYAGELNQQQALAAGFQMHLSKPVEPQHLVQMVAQVMGIRE